MTEQLKLKLNDSRLPPVGVLVIVAFTMMAAYYVNDVVAPLKTMLKRLHGRVPISDSLPVVTGFSNVFPDVDLGRINPRPSRYPFHRKAGNYPDGRWYST